MLTKACIYIIFFIPDKMKLSLFMVAAALVAFSAYAEDITKEEGVLKCYVS